MKPLRPYKERLLTTIPLAAAIALLAFALAAPAIYAYSPTTKSGRVDWPAQADMLIEAEDWQGLLDLSQRWAEREPQNPTARFDEGMAYGNLRRYDEAIEAYRRGLKLYPGSSAAWFDLGNSYGMKDRYAEAIEAYTEAARIDPRNLDILVNLGHAYIQVDRYDNAIQMLDRASRIDPTSVRVWNNLAIAFFLKGDKAAARNAALKLKRLDPHQADKVLKVISSP